MADCEQGSGRDTNTTAASASNFDSYGAAEQALDAELMRQAEADRAANGKDCSARSCTSGSCVTVIYNVGRYHSAIYSYRSGNAIKYGYRWEGGVVSSGCRCEQGAAKKTKKRRR